MIEIQLTDRDFKLARERVEKMTQRRKNAVTRIVAIKDHELIGVLGEIAFEKYCNYAGLKLESHKDDTGKRGDLWDYKINFNGVKYFFDVKTTSKYDTICMKEYAYIKAIKQRDLLIVGVKVDLKTKTAVIWGMANAGDFQRDHAKDFEYNGTKYLMYSIPRVKIYPFKINDCII